MHWTILMISAVLEAVWATALGMSDGLSRTGPAVVFFVALTLSMFGLGYAMRGIPIGTAYAVWTGAGAALTVGYAMVFGGEPASVLKLLFVAGIIGCVIGLKLADTGDGKKA
jgi:quaternary ammonium compound-resistance protein SugE